MTCELNPQSGIKTEFNIIVPYLIIKMLYFTTGIAFAHVFEKLIGFGKMYKYGIVPHNEAQPPRYEVLEANVSKLSFGSNHVYVCN